MIRRIYIFLTVLMVSILPVVWASEEGAHEAHHGNVGPSLDTVYRAINFFVLMFVLYKVIKQPAIDFFKARAEALNRNMETARVAYQELLQKSEEVNAKLNRLEKESAQMLAQYKAEGELESAKLIADAQSMAEKIKTDAVKMANNELKKAREELKTLAINLAGELAEKKLKAALTPDVEARLQKDFSTRLEGGAL